MEADEIERRDFVTTFRGYDRSAVDAYLKEAAQEVRRLNKELSKARSAAERAEIEKHARPPKPAADKVDAYRQVGEETAKVLMAAEVAANEIRESGRRQATEIIAEARRKAQQLVKEAGEGRRDIEEDINRLRETRAVIAAELEDVKKRLSDAVARLQAPLEPAVREAPAAAGKLPAGGEAAKRTKPAKPPQATPQPKIARSDEPERPAKTPAPSEHPPGHVPAETVEAEPVAPDPSRTNGSRPAEKVAESTASGCQGRS